MTPLTKARLPLWAMVAAWAVIVPAATLLFVIWLPAAAAEAARDRARRRA